MSSELTKSSQQAAEFPLVEQRLSERSLQWLLAIVCIALLVPFVSKPAHIDDPLYIWAAQQISTDWRDFYGFQVNWYVYPEPMSEVMKNPPLFAYYLAPFGAIAGWSVSVLHLVTIPFAIAVVLGTARLAAHLGANPLRSGLMLAASPIFLVSATTIMCDMMMLAAWTWSICFWVEALSTGSRRRFTASALLACAAVLAKYYGASLVLLLAFYTLISSSRWKLRGGIFLLPVPAVIAAYEYMTAQMYGVGLLSDAAYFAIDESSLSLANAALNVSATLAFLGAGCIALLLLTLLNSRREMFACVVLAICAAVAHVSTRALGESGNLLGMQQVLAIAASAVLIVVSAAEVARRHSPEALLLGAWVAGALVFAALINWSVNARALLPSLPAAAILITLRFQSAGKAQMGRLEAFAIVGTMLISLVVASADYSLALSMRRAAHDIVSRYRTSEQSIWFQGHWGFQYYMQELGAKPLDYRNPKILAGDLIVVPSSNSHLKHIPAELAPVIEVIRYPIGNVYTMNSLAGAGFYSAVFGRLPFTFGIGHDEEYQILRMSQDVSN